MSRLTIDEVINHCRETCESIEIVAIAQGKNQDDITSKQYWEHYLVGEWLNELKKYEDAEEQGLLPKFHLGDEFWTVHYDGVTKEKIVMLQQKKDGTWKYRFPNTCDYEESDYGKYFFDAKDEAEKFWEERYGSDK